MRAPITTDNISWYVLLENLKKKLNFKEKIKTVLLNLKQSFAIRTEHAFVSY